MISLVKIVNFFKHVEKDLTNFVQELVDNWKICLDMIYDQFTTFNLPVTLLTSRSSPNIPSTAFLGLLSWKPN